MDFFDAFLFIFSFVALILGILSFIFLDNLELGVSLFAVSGIFGMWTDLRDLSKYTKEKNGK